MNEQAQHKEWVDLPLSEKMRVEIAMASCYADDVAKLEQTIANLLEIAIARGEQLGYEDEDYRELLEQLTND